MRAIRRGTIPLVFALLTAPMAATGMQAEEMTRVDPDVLQAREAAWRAYFAGDGETLGGLLPPEFIGIGMSDGPFADLATTLAGSRQFRARGGRLVRLEFPEMRAQRYGDVVVLYGRYEAVIDTDGQEQTLRGRLTELFVRRDGKWLHPGWHLDLTARPAPRPD